MSHEISDFDFRSRLKFHGNKINLKNSILYE